MGFAMEARYPFEIWVVPHERVPDMSRLDPVARLEFASLLDMAAQRLDAVFDAPMPYTFSWQLAPRGYEDSFHFHCIFQPLLSSSPASSLSICHRKGPRTS